MKEAPTNENDELMNNGGLGGLLSQEDSPDYARDRLIVRLRLLWNHRRFFLRAAVYGLVVSALIAFLIPKRFESTVRLMPPDPQSGQGLAMLAALSGRAGGLGGFAGDLLGLKSSGSLFLGILRSRTVEDRLIERFNLRDLYNASDIEHARLQLEENTQISEDRKSGIIALTVTDGDPRLTKDMAQAYVQELDRLVTQVSTSAARRERVFLESRLKAVKQELDQAQIEFSKFASKNAAIDIKEQGRAMVEAAATLAGHLIAAQTELEGLRQVYTDNNVRVRAAQARIAELKRQLKKLRGDAPDVPSNLTNDEESIYPSIRKLPLLGVTYADLFRRTKINEVVFELLTQQYELAKVQEAKEIPTVRVLDLPVVPETKSYPPRLLIISSGMFLTLFGAAAYVFLARHWELMPTNDPARAFAQEVYATLQGQIALHTQNGWRLREIALKLRSHFRKTDTLAVLDGKEQSTKESSHSGDQQN